MEKFIIQGGNRLEGSVRISGAKNSVVAILPAVLYFAGVFIAVHLEAKKEGLKGLTKEELPRIIPLLKQSYLLLPLILLIYLLSLVIYYNGY